MDIYDVVVQIGKLAANFQKKPYEVFHHKYFITSEALSQRFNVRYRTALDSTNIPHSIVFLNNKTVKINLWRGPGVYFTDSKDLPNEFNYLKNNDTITIEYADKETLQPTNSIAYRIIKSKFIVKTN